MQINYQQEEEEEEEQNPNKIYEMYLRFQSDLEFVQMLANPQYLGYLAHENYFQDQKFLNYLKYLNYFKTPEYLKFIKYPQCLKFLDLAQIPSFQKELLNPEWIQILLFQQQKHWEFLGNYEQIVIENLSQQQLEQTNSKTNSND